MKLRAVRTFVLVLSIFALSDLMGGPSPPGELDRSSAPLTVDGVLLDSFWEAVSTFVLIPTEEGVPEETGGEIRLGLRGDYLCLSAELPEPGGRILARSVGRDPVWEQDSGGSPEVEDRLELQIRYAGEGAHVKALSLTVNPWGACRIQVDGAPDSDLEALCAARVGPDAWSLEAALSLRGLGLNGRALGLRAIRYRSRRPLAPEFRWEWPGSSSNGQFDLGELEGLGSPALAPPLLGNQEEPLAVGFLPKLPGLEPEWDSREWKNVAAHELLRNEPYPRRPRYRTRFKVAHDGQKLAFLFEVSEPEPLVADQGGRDAAIQRDDHVAIHLATTGSAFLEMLVNPVGAVSDARAVGPHITRPSASWNGRLETRTDIAYGGWTARVDVPLQECAESLGESGIPRQWRLLLSRRRAPRSGEAEEVSAWPVTGLSQHYGPVHYRRVILSEQPADSLPVSGSTALRSSNGELAARLEALDSRVWNDEFRRFHGIRGMLGRHLRQKIEKAVWDEREAWSKVTSLEDWQDFRETRLRALRESVGLFPPERPPLDIRVSSRYEGDGYRRENLVFQSRPGFYVTANLYLPADPAPPLPAIIIQHSHHYPRTQGELQDMGMLWARAGCAVLVVERLGFGERVETTPWYRQSYASRFTFAKQLALVGESHIGWQAWDLVRSVDFLLERGDIDAEKIILMGAVAGGGQPAALAAALDPRISAVIPFNYDQGHIDMEEDLVGKISGQFSPWFISASIAPRHFVRAFEFGWEGAEEPDYPGLWTSGWLRSQRVWGFYEADENLASAHAYGLIRLSMERVSHCFSVGPQQRAGLYPIFHRWFGIPFPSPQDLQIMPDSGLSVNPSRDAARQQEAARRRPESELLCIPPDLSGKLARRSLHDLAGEMASRHLAGARERRGGLGRKEELDDLKSGLAGLLGDLEVSGLPDPVVHWTRSLGEVGVEAMALQSEEGIQIPLLFLRPAHPGRTPVVIGVAQGGKDRFLTGRSSALQNLLQAGISVCLPDLRGIGETAPDFDSGDYSAERTLAEQEFYLGKTLLGARLKDLRSVIRYVRTRPDVRAGQIALWGDAFAPPNPRPLYLDEIQYSGGPQIQFWAEPLGAMLALLGALYEEDVAGVVAEGGLAGYQSMLEHAFSYVPTGVVVPGILKVADVQDIAASLVPRPLLMAASVNGRNQLLSTRELGDMEEHIRQAYRRAGASQALQVDRESGSTDLASWLISRIGDLRRRSE